MTYIILITNANGKPLLYCGCEFFEISQKGVVYYIGGRIGSGKVQEGDRILVYREGERHMAFVVKGTEVCLACPVPE